MKFRTLLLGLSALFIASAAAFFSVTGLSKLFAGASTAVILMASSLEFGKLISAGFLYNYWDKINKGLRAYLVIGVGVLILITSAGIYGFLTSAYQVTADQLGVVDRQVELVELKKGRFQEQLDGYNIEKQQLAQSISELSKGLSNNVIQYKDKETGELITTTSSATRRALEAQLNDTKSQRELISKKIEVLSDSITSLDLKALNIQQSSEVAGEVGPLKYMAEITGKPMSTIVNWFALLIIFVFDPLAVTLVIAFNTALKIDKGEDDKKKVVQKRELYGESEELPKDKKNDDFGSDSTTDNEGSDIYTEDDFTDWDTTLLDGLEDEAWEEEPNEVLKEAAERYKESDVSYEDNKVETDKLTMDDELSNLTKDINRRGIDIDGDGTIDGYDNTGDGLIDEPVPSSSRRAKYVMNELPYYAKPNFNWGDRKSWINNQNAVNYWLTYVKNEKDDTKYPKNFDSKTY
jgi:hypothetical protein